MSATSVTGQGSGAARNTRGSDRQTLGHTHLVGVRAECAGRVTMSGTTATVSFPTALSGSHTNYAVILTGEGSTNCYVSTRTDSSGSFASFVVTGGSGDTINWVVFKTGVR